MAGWVRRFEAPREVIRCPRCGKDAQFNFEFGREGRTVTKVYASCPSCHDQVTYEIVTDFRQAYEYGEYVAELVGSQEENPGEGMSKRMRRFGKYTPDYSRTERKPGEDGVDWLRRVLWE